MKNHQQASNLFLSISNYCAVTSLFGSSISSRWFLRAYLLCLRLFSCLDWPCECDDSAVWAQCVCTEDKERREMWPRWWWESWSTSCPTKDTLVGLLVEGEGHVGECEEGGFEGGSQYFILFFYLFFPNFGVGGNERPLNWICDLRAN